ncbi:EAL and HDOD domain-containing protein [Fervidibacillus halotolerans]|uniref:HDOD domain-containing protein n=1 Tax=Fervidibacillus halotolerans TaxID=2980027 RepID=A0A9E8RXY9_9BACI|nr:HDOD domain-containing protein [Fervidibacillus halotolerans]WAA13260.1 HDOD domain-containing protein [Fervidibacillus halotolerans]
MEIYIARQPIYDRNRSVYGYELLYRSGKVKNEAKGNGDKETVEVLINSFYHFDIEELTNNKFVFINFTKTLLLENVPLHFPPHRLVIEILENIPLTNEILKMCKTYKEKGYQIALDDFILDKEHIHLLQLLPFIDLIKIDFPSTPKPMRKKLINIKQKYPIQLVAEKIETKEDYEEAYNEGFDLFQGFFFHKPMIFSKREIPPTFYSRMKLMNEIKKPEPDIRRITNIIETDISLSYNILKMINKHFTRTNKIKSINQAIVLLGLKEIQRWIFIISLRESIEEQDEVAKELLHTSLLRAKFCELFALEILQVKDAGEFFLTGMFSMIDTILQMPMEKVVTELPLQDSITAALLGEMNEHRQILNIIRMIERAEWKKVTEQAEKFGANEEMIFSIYWNAMRWAHTLIEDDIIFHHSD